MLMARRPLTTSPARRAGRAARSRRNGGLSATRRVPANATTTTAQERATSGVTGAVIYRGRAGRIIDQIASRTAGWRDRYRPDNALPDAPSFLLATALF